MKAVHKSGFVNIIGRPNVGKSTLMNVLVGEKMSIINRKPQTTRHRIIGIYNTEEYQVVFSDTPGIIYDPSYGMQYALNRAAQSAFEDADILIVLTDPDEAFDMPQKYLDAISNCEAKKVLAINKIDLMEASAAKDIEHWWNNNINFDATFHVSALNKLNTDQLLEFILHNLEAGPAYFPKDQLTDRPERFFVSEFIRDHLLALYHQEIPYSAEVVITAFKEDEDIVRIYADIYVNRKSQKSIIIGKGGKAIKKLGIESRKDMEAWLGKKVYLELYVRIKENWRDDPRQLQHFGYQ